MNFEHKKACSKPDNLNYQTTLGKPNLEWNFHDLTMKMESFGGVRIVHDVFDGGFGNQPDKSVNPHVNVFSISYSNNS